MIGTLFQPNSCFSLVDALYLPNITMAPYCKPCNSCTQNTHGAPVRGGGPKVGCCWVQQHRFQNPVGFIQKHSTFFCKPYDKYLSINRVADRFCCYLISKYCTTADSYHTEDISSLMYPVVSDIRHRYNEIFIPSLSLALEYNGEYHYRSVTMYPPYSVRNL